MTDTIMLTGATGTIGQMLLKCLASRANVEKIFILLRGDEKRSWPENVRPVVGDIRAGLELGIEAKSRREIQDRVSLVVHAAANTRFSATIEEARAVNVEGTKNVLAFASRCSRLMGVTALSTVHVAGRRSGTIREDELKHTEGFVNCYEQSKYEAELALRDRMSDLPIEVLRLSTLFGDSCTGRVTKPLAVHHALRLYYHSLAPMVPGAPDSPVDLLATDYAAAAAAYFATDGFIAGRTFQICGGQDTLQLGEMLEITLRMFLLCRPAWRKRAIEMPAIVNLEAFELFRASVMQLGEGMLRSSMDILGNFVPQLAYRKIYENQGAESALLRAGVQKPAVREFYPKVVRGLVDGNWGLGWHEDRDG